MSTLSLAIEVSRNVPPIDETELNLPDMRSALSAAEMLARLGQFDSDIAGYVDCWRSFTRSIGTDAMLWPNSDGSMDIAVGAVCDAQDRQRSAWLSVLIEDFAQDSRRKQHMIEKLLAQRNARSHAVT